MKREAHESTNQLLFSIKKIHCLLQQQQAAPAPTSPLQALFGTEEKRRKNGGLSSRGNESYMRVWNRGTRTNLSRGTATKVVLLEEWKNELRAKGKFPAVLAATLSAQANLLPCILPLHRLPISTSGSMLQARRARLLLLGGGMLCGGGRTRAPSRGAGAGAGGWMQRVEVFYQTQLNYDKSKMTPS